MKTSTSSSNTVAIIQARMGSSRLPEKVLMDIADKPMLEHVYERATCASLIDRVVIATSTKSGDDEIASFCEDRDIPYVRGSEADVLDRYYQTARETAAETIVRLTADCPLLSPAVIDRVVRVYDQSTAAYVTNIIEYTHPDGLDVEVFPFSVLESTWEEATAPGEREHVTLYIRESDEIESRNVENVIDTTKYTFTDDVETLRWTVDYQEDLEFVREVYSHLTEDSHWVFDQQSVFELLERRPQLREINENRHT